MGTEGSKSRSSSARSVSRGIPPSPVENPGFSRGCATRRIRNEPGAAGTAAPRGLIECQSIVLAVGQDGPIVYVSKRTPKRQI